LKEERARVLRDQAAKKSIDARRLLVAKIATDEGNKVAIEKMQTMASQMTNDVNEMRLLMRQTVENVKKDAIHEAETRSKNYDNFLAKKNEEYKVALEEASYQF